MFRSEAATFLLCSISKWVNEMGRKGLYREQKIISPSRTELPDGGWAPLKIGYVLEVGIYIPV